MNKKLICFAGVLALVVIVLAIKLVNDNSCSGIRANIEKAKDISSADSLLLKLQEKGCLTR